MSTHRRPSPRSSTRLRPVRAAARRLPALLVIAATIGAAVLALLLVSADVSAEAAVLVAISLILFAVAFATTVPAGGDDAARDAPETAQLGRDPEQAIGRRTGART